MNRRALTIVDLLDESANRSPDRSAISSPEATLSFSQLAAQTAAIAGFLVAHGVEAGDRIVIVGPSEPAFAAACYGALRAGAVAVPMGATARASEVVGILEHCSAKTLFISPAFPESREVTEATVLAGLTVVSLGNRKPGQPDAITSWEAVVAAALPPPRRRPTLNQAACILLTSGTTRRPTGVLLSHRGITINTLGIVDALSLGPSDSCLTGLPFNYSFGSSILNTHVAVGGTVIVAPSMVFPARVLAAIETRAPTGFYGVPSTFAMLLSRTDPGSAKTESLRYLAQAGGAMPEALQARVRAAFPSAELFIMYGQTEATARISILPPAFLDTKVGSVGRPVAGVEVSIRGHDGESLAADHPGEIWVRGESVMTGYWQDPEATAKVLRDGWLRTGDIGQVDADGFLFIIGRRDDIIKSGAYRIHPLEIEEVVLKLDSVEEVAVVGRDDDQLGQVVAAFVVLREGHHLDADTVRKHCKAWLSGYKVPAAVQFVAALPRTASGKIRRKELSSQ